MKKFSTPVILILAVVAAVAINAWRGARGVLNTAAADSVTTSNKLAEVTAKLAEQGAANETLRVQLNLQKSDLGGASNRLHALAGKLEDSARRARELERQLQQRDAQITALNGAGARLQASLDQLQSRSEALQSELEAAHARVVEVSKRLEATRSSLNESETEKAALMQKFNDPSVLRAQMKAVTSTPGGKTSSSKAPLKLQPDGSIAFDTAAVTDPPKPAKAH